MEQIHLIQVGFIIILIGLAIVIFGGMSSPDTKFSVFGIFGFIPFGFSNDKRLFYIGIGITITLLLVSLLLRYLQIKRFI